MCGICGVIGTNGDLNPAVRDAIGEMTHTLHHRGPDGEGTFADTRAALGHARLAIIDRAGGAQPMPNEDRTCWVVFNGEIYNHRTLRQDLLARGHQFRTTSDTEVIVHAYEEYGTGCVEKFEGMFAFAVYDATRHEVLLARDRLGKKPLFWAVLDGALHFASEIKAIRPSPAWDDSIDLSALESYLSLGYVLAPDTIYRRVRKLEPGHWLKLTRGRIETRKYWDVEEFDTRPHDDPSLRQELESTMRERVVERLESEVPLGAFLGRIDQARRVVHVEALGDELRTTTVGFSDTAHNELQAQLTARAFRTRHDEAVLESRLTDVLDPTFAHSTSRSRTRPPSRPTTSQIARRHVTVRADRRRGDESFAGHDFRHAASRAHVRLWIWSLGGRAAAASAAWPRWQGMPKPPGPARCSEHGAGRRYGARGFAFSPSLTNRLLDATAPRHPRRPAHNASPRRSPLHVESAARIR
jgi:asparagine synthase (glutamine-hydrolysing)